MSRRHQQYNEKLSARQLDEFRAMVAKMGRPELEDYYKACHNCVRYSGMRVCSPQAMQEFVQVWRRLRQLKGSGMVWP